MNASYEKNYLVDQLTNGFFPFSRDKFRIDTFTGGIFTVGKFLISDEQGMVYDLSVVASDRGRPALR